MEASWQWQDAGTSWKGVGIYHLTLTVASREPLLGALVIPDDDPTQAHVEATALGRSLLECQRSLSLFFPEIQILQYCLMPDHLHSVWYVRRPMAKSIRYVAQGFWRSAKKQGRAYSYLRALHARLEAGAKDEKGGLSSGGVLSLGPASFGPALSLEAGLSLFAPASSRENPLRQQLGDEAYYALPPLFTEVPFIRPLSRRGQLQSMISYVQLNPQRLATKRLMPGFFRVQDGIVIAGRTYAAVGNVALLQVSRRATVHVRSHWVKTAEQGNAQPLRDYMNGCVIAARQGTLLVSPFISEKEKAVQNVLLKELHPFIVLADNGFRDYYKPPAALFDAVAAGRVLILSPWPHDAQKRHISRADCVALNDMAEEIANEDD